ncbi:MAG TPA: hypothetical protein VL359_10920, partial [bacterium]|nr:hypothetical protein [bacterium]
MTKRMCRLLAAVALALGLAGLGGAGLAQAQVQKDNKFAVGVGLAFYAQPEESAFSSSSNPVDVFLDWDLSKTWLKFRVGY